MNDAREKYADIIDHDHHVSAKHPPMSRLNRAAQFSPFAALSGYEDLIAESERETDARAELDEDGKEELNRKLLWLLRQADPTEATVTYFVPDSKKAGGAYASVTGVIDRFDGISKSIVFRDGTRIFVEDIAAVTSDAIKHGQEGPDPH